ncbi:MAG: CehA/McbA family metallohydrolase [Armatimonadota bacterium]|nr:CehA/McbA family metallohydrolase [Armatimonadota bacterium]
MRRSASIFVAVCWALASLVVAGWAMPAKKLPIPPKGVAEALVATERDLPTGPKAEGRVGDYVLRNHLVTFVIAGNRPTHGYGRFGGRLVDAVRHENGRQADFLGEMFYGVADARGLLGARTLRPERIEIVSAGGRGKPAILRVQMVDERLPLIDQTVRLPSQPMNLKVTLTYTLEPDSPTLLIEATLHNGTDRPQTYSLVQAWIQDDGMQMYLPPFGSAKVAQGSAAGAGLAALVQTLRGDIPFAAAVNHHLSYGLIPLGGKFASVQRVQDIYLFTLLNGASVPPSGSTSVRWAFTVGKGETETTRLEYYRLLGQAPKLERTSGIVQSAAGVPLENARVYLFQQANGREQFITVVRTDSAGRFEANLPPGEYRAMAFADYHTPQEFRLSVPTGALPMVSLPTPAYLRLRATDGNGRPQPTTVVFERLDAPNVNAERRLYGEDGNFGRWNRVHFSLTGNETLPVEPGRYRITLLRGFEYEIAQREVELRSGETVEWSAALAHTAPLPGYLSGDYHLHTHTSPDSYDAFEDKIASYVAMDVHIVVTTDHDYHTDLAPTVRAMGLTHRVATIVGNEITPTNGIGHFNAFPQRYDPNAWNNGAIEWYDKKAGEIFAAARRNYSGDTIVMVNHPRAPTMGYFLYVGLDPITGEIKRPNELSEDFDAIEVMNGMSAAGAELIMRDWFYFLNKGKRVLGIGTTDGHHCFHLQPGLPRTYVYFGHRDPSRVTPANLVAQLRKGDVVVSSGPVVTFTAADMRNPQRPMRIGDTLKLQGDAIVLNVEARAASWVRVKALEVIVNGKVVQEVPLNQPEGKPLAYKATLTVPVQEQRGWLLVRIVGEKFTALFSETPIAFTNPVYWER